MSFIFGVTGSTELSAIPGALATGDPMMLLGMTLLLAGLGFQDRQAFPFHMWAPDALRPAAAVCRVARGGAEGRGFHRDHPAVCRGRRRGHARLMPVIAAVAGMTIITGNLMAIPQQQHQAAAGGIGHRAHRLRMLVGLVAVSRALVSGWCSSTWSYAVREHGRLLRRRSRGRGRRTRKRSTPTGGAQRSPLLALAMLIFPLSLGGIPFVAGSGEAVRLPAAIDRGWLASRCSSAPC